MEQYRNSNVGEEKRSMDQDCLDGHRCSRHCSPVKEHPKKKSKNMAFPKLLYNMLDNV